MINEGQKWAGDEVHDDPNLRLSADGLTLVYNPWKHP